MATQKQYVDLDMGSASKIIQLPVAVANGQPVRFEEHSEVEANVDDLVSLTGVAENATNFGAFDGASIRDNKNLKEVLQDLEDAAEANQLEVAADSTAFLDISGNEISISSLAITSVEVDDTYATLAAYIAGEAVAFAAKEEADVLILTQAESQVRSWIHNGGTSGTAADMTRLQTDITPSAIRSYISAEADHLLYDNATGVMTFAPAAVENLIPTSHTFVGIGAPAHVQDFMEKVDAELSGLQGGTSLNAQSVTFAKLADAAVCSDFSSAGAEQIARADSVKAYIDGRSYIRHENQDLDLTGGVYTQISHGLGNKYVHCSVYDSDDVLMNVEVKLVDSNTLKIKSTITADDCKLVIMG